MPRYGTPYKGSKNAIAEWVVSHLPPAETFVDLFSGGCAVTHAAILSGKFERFVANDLTDAPQVFVDAVNGEFDGFATVPTREEFMASDDEALRLMYSFGNNRKDYLWSRELEPVKVNATKMVLAPSVHERKRAYNGFMRALGEYVRNGTMPDSAGHDGELQGLQGLQRLQGRISVSRRDYRAVGVPEGATVYADPPYRGTCVNAYGEYGTGFDFETFDKWLSIVPFPVIVSEYTAPDGCVEIAHIEKRVNSAANGKSGNAVERLFVQERFADAYREQKAKEQQDDGIR